MLRARRSKGLFPDLFITHCVHLSLRLCLSGSFVCRLCICLKRLIRCFEQGIEMQRKDFHKTAELLGKGVKQ